MFQKAGHNRSLYQANFAHARRDFLRAACSAFSALATRSAHSLSSASSRPVRRRGLATPARTPGAAGWGNGASSGTPCASFTAGTSSTTTTFDFFGLRMPMPRARGIASPGTCHTTATHRTVTRSGRCCAGGAPAVHCAACYHAGRCCGTPGVPGARNWWWREASIVRLTV